MYLLDTYYFSYKMRMQNWIMSFLALIFSWWFQLIWYSSKCMHRNQLKTQLCCSLNPIVNQEAQCFDREWVSCYHVFGSEPSLCLFPSSVISFQSVIPFHWLLPLDCEPWSLPQFGHSVSLYCCFSADGCQLTVPCCVRVLWGNIHVWLLCLILNLRWTSGNLLLFIKNDFG